MKYVLPYESADDVLAKALAHFEAHTARGKEFYERRRVSSRRYLEGASGATQRRRPVRAGSP